MSARQTVWAIELRIHSTRWIGSAIGGGTVVVATAEHHVASVCRVVVLLHPTGVGVGVVVSVQDGLLMESVGDGVGAGA